MRVARGDIHGVGDCEDRRPIRRDVLHDCPRIYPQRCERLPGDEPLASTAHLGGLIETHAQRVTELWTKLELRELRARARRSTREHCERPKSARHLEVV